MKYKVILGWRCEFICNDINSLLSLTAAVLKADRVQYDEDDRMIQIEPIPEEGEENE